MIRLPIQSSEKRVPEHIPEAVIDRLFNNNTGENLPLPKMERKPLSFSFNKPIHQTNPLPKKESPPKIIDQAMKSPAILTSNVSAKILDKAEKMAEKIIACREAATARQQEQTDNVMPNFKDIEPLTGSLLFLPQSGPQFYAAWKELAEEKRFLYLKVIISRFYSNFGLIFFAILGDGRLEIRRWKNPRLNTRLCNFE